MSTHARGDSGGASAVPVAWPVACGVWCRPSWCTPVLTWRALTTVVATCYLLRVPTRRMEKLVETQGITRLSTSQVSEMCLALGLVEAPIPGADEGHDSTTERPRGASGADHPVGGGRPARSGVAARRLSADQGASPKAAGSDAGWPSRLSRHAGAADPGVLSDIQQVASLPARVRRRSGSRGGRVRSCSSDTPLAGERPAR